MTFKANIAPQGRGFFYANSGNDSQDGRSLETPKETIQAALDAAAALSPIPSPANAAAVCQAQGGTYAESIVLQDHVLFDAATTSLISSDPIVVTAANSIPCNLQTASGSAVGGTTILIDGKSSFGLDSRFVGASGDNSIAVRVTGICDDIFLTTSQVRLSGDGTKGFVVDAVSPTPIDINVNTGVMDNDNQTFFEWNQTGAQEASVINASTIISLPTITGCEAIHVIDGNLNVITQLIDCDSICTIESGASLTLDANILIGDILVKNGGRLVLKAVGVLVGNITIDSGGAMSCDITEHQGTVTNNGNINGNIIDTTGDNVHYSDIVFVDAGMELHDPFGERRGLVKLSNDYGIIVSGLDNSINPQPMTLGGSQMNILSSQIAIRFGGQEEGEVLILGPQITLPTGDTAHILESVPFNVTSTTETFLNSSDVILTGTFQDIVSGTTTDDYVSGQAFSSYEFVGEEQANQSTEIEYRATINGSPSGPVLNYTIDKVNGTTQRNIFGTATVATDIAIGDTFALQARAVDIGSGRVTTAKGTVTNTRASLNTGSQKNKLIFSFTKNGNLMAEGFLLFGEVVTSETVGFVLPVPASLEAVSIGRTDTDATSIEVLRNGSVIATVATSATSTLDKSMSVALLPSDILSIRNISGGSTMSDAIVTLLIET